MKKIIITGSAGLLGPYVVAHFVEQGYDVLSVDRIKPVGSIARHVTADLTNLGECYGILAGADAVVHLAAIPTAYIFPNEVTFQNNVMSTHNMLEAASGLGIQKAVIASSECAYGICNSRQGLEPIRALGLALFIALMPASELRLFHQVAATAGWLFYSLSITYVRVWRNWQTRWS